MLEDGCSEQNKRAASADTIKIEAEQQQDAIRQ